MSEIEGGYYMEHAVFLACLSLVLRITWRLCVVCHLMLILISQFTIIYLFILFSVIKVFFFYINESLILYKIFDVTHFYFVSFFIVFMYVYLTIILRGRAGYRMIDNQRGA